MIYAIPGPDGSLEPGKRLLNVVWYLNESEASLQEILIDGLDGHRHRNTVPAGHSLFFLVLHSISFSRPSSSLIIRPS
jgi:hypothetical protein